MPCRRKVLLWLGIALLLVFVFFLLIISLIASFQSQHGAVAAPWLTGIPQEGARPCGHQQGVVLWPASGLPLMPAAVL